MKKIYFYAVPLLFALSSLSCSKDFLKSYERRIIGTWRIDDLNRVGIGGSTSRLPFQDGQFIFAEEGQLTYIDNSGTYKGTWDIRREPAGDDQQARSLHINVVNFTTQQSKAEYFNEVVFTGTNRFKAFIRDGVRSYVYRFER
ncbi:MAG TPA: hypothetical protein VHK69_19740 [Chitinophagaceae bacterium]|nr:hypothetical protein [Chitinophagaceae bacterium]